MEKPQQALMRGRVIVDTGHTKLWLNWKEGGTDRYVNNATIWLFGICIRLEWLRANGSAGADVAKWLRHPLADHGAVETSLRGGAGAKTLPLQQWKIAEFDESIKVYSSQKPLDIVLVVDTSGSMGQHFGSMQMFARKMVGAFEIGSSDNRIGIVNFSSRAFVEGSGFMDDCSPGTVGGVIDKLTNQCGGTYFGAALDATRSLLDGARLLTPESLEDRQPIVIFQTDGYASDSGRWESTAADLVKRGAIIVAVGVGGGNFAELRNSMVGAPAREGGQDVPKSQLLVTVTDYRALLGVIDTIKGAAVGAL